MGILKIFFVCGFYLFVNGDINYNIDDKVVLSPRQLADMVQRETMEKKPRTNRMQYTHPDVKSFSKHVTTTELTDDESRLKARKVWSRWGKWGECSVTCGDGVVGRSRVCVAGRCAAGEREEQMRPCSRPPCIQHTTQSQLETE